MKNTLTILCLVSLLNLFGQDTLTLVGSDQSKISFSISKDKFLLHYQPEYQATIQRSLKGNFIEISNEFAIISMTDNQSITGKIQSIGNTNARSTSHPEPILIYEDGIEQAFIGEMIIKLNGTSALDELELLDGFEYSYSEDEFVNGQYLIKFKNLTTKESFDLTNMLINSGKVDFAEPNFVRFLKTHTADPLFNNQWTLRNQGYLGGTSDADMDVEEAWNTATGNGVVIAIIDEGVDLSHPDLNDNLLSGFDATGNNSGGAPNEANNDAHGTNCAGIAASVANNTTGIAGVAYDAEILPVRIARSNGFPLGDNRRAWITSNSQIASGINWAVNNGADILSNSWGGGSPSSAITNAINNAVNNGRGGKGCIVLFSTGNFNTSVSYPATLSSVIAVGATTMCDERKRSTSSATQLAGRSTQPDPSGTSCDGEWWWGSNFGSEIDVVAPGVQIYATDISGTAGYESGDYTPDFNGTSSACPNAAGVAALVLSVNHTFSQSQVREILEKSTDKIGGYAYTASVHRYGGTATWNNEVGYGRLNANSAVDYAVNYDNYFGHSISGPTQLTPGYQATYHIPNEYVFATNYVWSIPSGCSSNYCWTLLSGQGSSQITVRAGKTGVHDITCTIYNGSQVIGNQYITVNVQSTSGGGGGGGNDPCGDIGMTSYVIYPPVPCDGAMNANGASAESLKFVKTVIYSLNGQIALESNEQAIDISHLRSGLYIIKSEMENGEILTKKIIR